MSVQACAEIVRKGDPDRFLSVMAAAPKLRAALFPIYAFNVEVARAPWVTKEPMIAEMRLQWWRDALAEIMQGETARRHEVVTPLAEVIDATGAALLDKLIQARRWDVYSEPFEDEAHFSEYLAATGGGLMRVAARAIGCREDVASIGEIGYASGLANWLSALSELEARGRIPLVDGRPDAIAALAKDGFLRLEIARKSAPKLARPATRAGWQAGRTLRSAATNPATIIDGRLHIPEFQRKGILLWRVLTNAP